MNSGLSGSALAQCLTIALSSVLAAFCLDAAIFRSGFYKDLVSPDSSAGSVQQMIRIEKARALPNARRVLVLGNSQQAEGFSARIAGQVLAPDRIDIGNAGVPGLTTRDWFYVDRDLDPKATRYNVIAIPFTDYADLDYQDLQASRVQDLNFLIGSLRLSDLVKFSSSFPMKDRWPMFWGALWEGVTYRDDIRDFLLAPRKRIALAADYRLHGMDWQDGYGGSDKSLQGFTYNAATGAINFPPGTAAETEQLIHERLNPKDVAVRGIQRAYLRKWLGAIEERYRGKDIRFVLFRMPQYAVHLKLPPADPESFVARMAHDPRVTVLPENEFDWLESPQYAFDGLHLNAKGRAAFSAAFGKKLAEALQNFHPAN